MIHEYKQDPRVSWVLLDKVPNKTRQNKTRNCSITIKLNFDLFLCLVLRSQLVVSGITPDSSFLSVMRELFRVSGIKLGSSHARQMAYALHYCSSSNWIFKIHFSMFAHNFQNRLKPRDTRVKKQNGSKRKEFKVHCRKVLLLNSTFNPLQCHIPFHIAN